MTNIKTIAFATAVAFSFFGSQAHAEPVVLKLEEGETRFFANIEINGRSTRCLIDTGAYNGIFIDTSIAKELNLIRIRGVNSSGFSGKKSYGYRTKVREVRFGTFVGKGMAMSVYDMNNKDCNAGMEFLKFFDIRLKNGTMTISEFTE